MLLHLNLYLSNYRLLLSEIIKLEPKPRPELVLLSELALASAVYLLLFLFFIIIVNLSVQNTNDKSLKANTLFIVYFIYKRIETE